MKSKKIDTNYYLFIVVILYTLTSCTGPRVKDISDAGRSSLAASKLIDQIKSYYKMNNKFPVTLSDLKAEGLFPFSCVYDSAKNATLLVGEKAISEFTLERKTIDSRDKVFIDYTIYGHKRKESYNIDSFN